MTKASTAYRNVVRIPAVIELTHGGVASGTRVCERFADEVRAELVVAGRCLFRRVKEPDDEEFRSPDRFEVRIELVDGVERIGGGGPVRSNDL